jgi:hypothetical protein
MGETNDTYGLGDDLDKVRDDSNNETVIEGRPTQHVKYLFVDACNTSRLECG